jgi:GNAT superfamily N-acetyltransferase
MECGFTLERWRGGCKTVIMQIAADLQRAFAEGGPKTVVTRTFRNLVRPAVKMGTLVFSECDLGRPLPEARPVPGIVIREATIDDAVLFGDRELFLERLHQGNRCFMGIEQKTGKLTNSRWINTSVVQVPEINRYFILKPGEAYAFDLKTLPEFRRRGIDTYTRNYVYSYFRDIGYSRIYAYIHGDNHPSLKASRRLLKPVGRVWYFQARGFEPIMIVRRGSNFPELRRMHT